MAGTEWTERGGEEEGQPCRSRQGVAIKEGKKIVKLLQGHHTPKVASHYIPNQGTNLMLSKWSPESKQI